MEQYIRDLALFGVNSIEAIPFQDPRPSPVMKVTRREMNRAMSEVCDRYGLDYWIWAPADFDLTKTDLRAKWLARYDEFIADSKSLSGIFFPGGDPGDNTPDLVLPFLEELEKHTRTKYPNAKIWLSMQSYSKAQVDSVYEYIDRNSPAWFGGLVFGPSSPSLPQTRQRLSKKYQLRLYPDLTHNKLSQFQVPAWDQAFALTLGREAINPRPVEYARIHDRIAPYANGFISYSDGVHDDVNKTIWSALSWDPARTPRDILIDYAHVYFEPSLAEPVADAILALEKNWRGPLLDNGSVEGTLNLWQQLAKAAPQLESNWRWQMYQLRANYDAYIRHRLINETHLEEEANSILASAKPGDSSRAITQAVALMNRPTTQPVSPDLRARIEDLGAKLFQSIGIQTSSSKYFASDPQRGAVLDFVDLPLNNRWWLEDELKKVSQLPSEPQKIERLHELAAWEHPGPGSYYDNPGNASKSRHVARETHEVVDTDSASDGEPTFWWWDLGKSRTRLTWQTTLWPKQMAYAGLDPKATYKIRSTGYGQALLRINGERVEPTLNGKEIGEFKEFPVDPKYLQTGKLILTWDIPTDESHLNWRKKSRLAEVWLLKTN
jgi:hypothetical protein